MKKLSLFVLIHIKEKFPVSYSNPNEFDTSGPLGKSLGRNNSRENRNGLIVRVFFCKMGIIMPINFKTYTDLWIKAVNDKKTEGLSQVLSDDFVWSNERLNYVANK